MANKNAGREDSVTAAFQSILFQEAINAGKAEAFIPLNGADRYFNADGIFRAFNNFVLVESKSAASNIRDESRKPSACRLCLALQQNTQAEIWHRKCHYIMWATRQGSAGLDPFTMIYQDGVCNSSVLPACSGLRNHGGFPNDGRVFAREILDESIGLTNPDFVNYLAWLISLRPGGSGAGLPTTLYATSLAGGYTSIAFDSFSDLANWAAPALTMHFRGPRNNMKP